MNAYLVTYDLNKPRQNYEALYDAIQATGTWWHYLDSTWLVTSNETPSAIAARLRSVIDQNDSLLVMRVTNSPAADGWLKQEAWDWITTNVPAY
jgi:hypothetical protein